MGRGCLNTFQMYRSGLSEEEFLAEAAGMRVATRIVMFLVLSLIFCSSSINAGDLSSADQRIPEPKREQSPNEKCDGLLIQVAQSKAKRCIKPGSGQVFKDCPDCPEMVVVPGGSFTMGAPETEPQRDREETQHTVRIAKPFAVGRFSVTFAEWDACTADGGCRSYKPDDEGWGRGDRPS